MAVVLDITARRQAELLAPRPQSDFEEHFERGERAPIGTGLLDGDGRWLLVNRALCDITGYTADELIGKRFEAIVHPEDAHNDSEQRGRLLAGEIPAFRVDKRCFDAAGETISAIVSMSLVRDRDGAPLYYIAQLQDVSERRRLEENMRGLADHDPLTGLRNRRLFGHDLKLQVARSRRYGEVAGLMVIDLDAFGRVNDRHGEQAGDEALEAVARALTRRLRETDLVARLGADQFAVLLPHIDEEGLAVVAEGLDARHRGLRRRRRRRRAALLGEHRLHARGRAHRERRACAPAGRPRDALRPAGAALARRADRRAARSRAERPAGTLRRGEYAHRMQPNERLAVIDLGSNSFRLVVFMAGDGWWKRTDEIYEPVRIGEGLMATRQARGGADGAGARDARRVRPLLPRQRTGRGCGGRGRHERDPRRRERRGLPGAGARALRAADPRAQPRGGGPLRLPGGRQLDDAARRLRARPRRRLAAARARAPTG